MYSMSDLYNLMLTFSRRRCCDVCVSLTEYESLLYEAIANAATEHAKTQAILFKLHRHTLLKENKETLDTMEDNVE